VTVCLISDVIEEIYHAQKQRDAAMMQRLRLANEERDEAVMRVKKIQADGYVVGSTAILCAQIYNSILHYKHHSDINYR
jgi:hypothetical protein